MTPFLHACFSGIFGYFIALAATHRRHRFVFFLVGLALSSLLHGLYDTFVGESALLGVAVQVGSFFLLMTYILKARGLGSARELGGGVFSRTVMIMAPVVPPAAPSAAVSAPICGCRVGRAAFASLRPPGETRIGRDPSRCRVLWTKEGLARASRAGADPVRSRGRLRDSPNAGRCLETAGGGGRIWPRETDQVAPRCWCRGS